MIVRSTDTANVMIFTPMTRQEKERQFQGTLNLRIHFEI